MAGGVQRGHCHEHHWEGDPRETSEEGKFFFSLRTNLATARFCRVHCSALCLLAAAVPPALLRPAEHRWQLPAGLND